MEGRLWRNEGRGSAGGDCEGKGRGMSDRVGREEVLEDPNAVGKVIRDVFLRLKGRESVCVKG